MIVVDKFISCNHGAESNTDKNEVFATYAQQQRIARENKREVQTSPLLLRKLFLL